MPVHPSPSPPDDRAPAPPSAGDRTAGAGGDADQPPFIRAPEASRSIFLMIFAAACGPGVAGLVFFGWRALVILLLSVLSCVVTEAAYYRVRRTPALVSRAHAVVTGLLLGLTLPPFAPWYVPLAGGVFAIVVGKALFGGVGHFLWQPALVGRLAVAVLFAPPLMGRTPLERGAWPVLARDRLLLGDIQQVDEGYAYRRWRQTPAPPGRDALARRRPREILRDLTLRPASEPPPESILDTLRRMPPAWDLLAGAHGGGIGETCTLAILVAGLYLVYRHYFRPLLPGMFLLAAAATAAVAPVRTGDGLAWTWLPVVAEGGETGFVYVAYHLACGEVMLGAWFLATEMTSRPVTTPAQGLFGLAAGAGAMLMRLYLPIDIPAYGAILAANTVTPALDATLQRRPLGRKPWYRRIFGRR